MLYLQIVMAKILKFIGFLVLVLALWQTASNTFIGQAVDGEEYVNEKDVVIYHQQEEACITAPQLPYLPDAELAGFAGQSHLLTFLRVQRFSAIDCIFSLKDWVDMLSHRAAILSLHNEKLYDTTAYNRCHPVCDYYVFTLRRILI